MEGIEKAKLCARYADDKKAEDIVILDLREISPVTDFFVVCTANSSRTCAPFAMASKTACARNMGFMRSFPMAILRASGSSRTMVT